MCNFTLLSFFLQQDKPDVIRPKRKYEKKPKVLPSSAATPQQTSPAALPVFNAKDLNQYDFPSSDDEPLSQVGPLVFCAAFWEKEVVKLRIFLIPLLIHHSIPFSKVLSGSSEAEEENDPDGPFAFRRKAGCQYYAVSRISLCIVRQSIIV